MPPFFAVVGAKPGFLAMFIRDPFVCEHILATPPGNRRPSTMPKGGATNAADVSATNIIRPTLDELSAKDRAVLETQLQKVPEGFLARYEMTR